MDLSHENEVGTFDILDHLAEIDDLPVAHPDCLINAEACCRAGKTENKNHAQGKQLCIHPHPLPSSASKYGATLTYGVINFKEKDPEESLHSRHGGWLQNRFVL
jgi:hypothetical protein